MADKKTTRDASCQEAAAAKAAFQRAMHEARTSLGTAADVRLWTKKKPWLAVGLAATAGMAAAILLRRGGKSAAAHGDSANGAVPSMEQSSAARSSAESSGSGIGASIASSLFDLAKFGLETAIMGGIREATAKNNAPDHSQYQSADTAP